MSQSVKELSIAYVGSRIYGTLHRLRAARLAANASHTGNGSRSEGAEDEVSEEIVVYGESSNTGGGGVDVITLDPWMFEFHIKVIVPPVINLPDPEPGPGDDAPDPDPCATLAKALETATTYLRDPRPDVAADRA